MKHLILLLTLFSSTFSYADQCEVLSRFQIAGAKALIEHSIELTKGFLSLCQNCDETKAVFVKATGKVNRVKYDYEKGKFTIEMEGYQPPMDAAYLYVNTNQFSNNRNYLWFNLAELIGCPYTGSSQYITENRRNNARTNEFHNGPKSHETNAELEKSPLAPVTALKE